MSMFSGHRVALLAYSLTDASHSPATFFRCETKRVAVRRPAPESIMLLLTMLYTSSALLQLHVETGEQRCCWQLTECQLPSTEAAAVHSVAC